MNLLIRQMARQLIGTGNESARLNQTVSEWTGHYGICRNNDNGNIPDDARDRVLDVRGIDVYSASVFHSHIFSGRNVFVCSFQSCTRVGGTIRDGISDTACGRDHHNGVAHAGFVPSGTHPDPSGRVNKHAPTVY
ncbi:MAG: hypothetical protein WD623_15210 [Marinobacter sp.]|uniref:hypothetical protein n=1 Tax=Marinobacter sp. TaxID=50741 RepID=UPI00349FFF32